MSPRLSRRQVLLICGGHIRRLIGTYTEQKNCDYGIFLLRRYNMTAGGKALS